MILAQPAVQQRSIVAKHADMLLLLQFSSEVSRNGPSALVLRKPAIFGHQQLGSDLLLKHKGKSTHQRYYPHLTTLAKQPEVRNQSDCFLLAVRASKKLQQLKRHRSYSRSDALQLEARSKFQRKGMYDSYVQVTLALRSDFSRSKSFMTHKSKTFVPENHDALETSP